jgi:C-terminal processing protease CtpA/Prc
MTFHVFLVGIALAQSGQPQRYTPGALPEVSDEEFRLPLAAPQAEEVARLIGQLGSPDYRQREQASQRLVEIGAGAFDHLRTTYHQTDDLEVHLRIEQIVGQSYLSYHVYRRNGFLGVSQDRFGVTHEEDARIADGHVGIRIRQALPDTGAERAGLRENDVIIALDGQPLQAGPFPSESFGEELRTKGPGVQVVLTVLRGARQLDIEATLGQRPRMYYSPQQGESYEMLMAARRNFAVWWARYFRRPAPPLR